MMNIKMLAEIATTMMVVVGFILLAIDQVQPHSSNRYRWLFLSGALCTFSGILLTIIIEVIAPPPQESQEPLVSYVTLEGCMHQLPPSVQSDDLGVSLFLGRLADAADSSRHQDVQRRFHQYLIIMYPGDSTGASAFCLGEQGTEATVR
ncbi:MAG TPA: hypothetical protein VJC16_00725 [Candidatus Nanoarchaeia archaeon]|nr:hypothetical protein [Candidatus Nanoarchaeia archaeon]